MNGQFASGGVVVCGSEIPINPSNPMTIKVADTDSFRRARNTIVGFTQQPSLNDRFKPDKFSVGFDEGRAVVDS